MLIESPFYHLFLNLVKLLNRKTLVHWTWLSWFKPILKEDSFSGKWTDCVSSVFKEGFSKIAESSIYMDPEVDACVSFQKAYPEPRLMAALWACAMVSADDTCKMASWASANMFTQHYKLDLFNKRAINIRASIFFCCYNSVINYFVIHCWFVLFFHPWCWSYLCPKTSDMRWAMNMENCWSHLP